MSRREFKRVVVWFRRDLRVGDNAALSEACLAAEEVVPLFIFDDKVLSRPDTGAARASFLIDALTVLKKNLAALGSTLIIRCGSTPGALIACAKEFAANAVFFHEEYEPFGRLRDETVKRELAALGCGVRSFPGLCIIRPGELLSQRGSPYTVFTPFNKIWMDTPRRKIYTAPESINSPKHITSAELPSVVKLGLRTSQKFCCGGEDAAHILLENFVDEGLAEYNIKRDFVSDHGTSRLSAHLHFGTISPIAVAEVARGKLGSETYLSELAWRDFYFQILFHFPHVEKQAFRREFSNIRWDDDDRLFEAWMAGLTGYPIVDAAMRQLNGEAWMHNRARMIVASFLTKDLLVNWQQGERYFMQQLMDGDLAANNGGWQWSAGTGTDAQPFFRIFNPVTQGEKFDPDGKYVRKYIPELARVPTSHIHSPWKLSAAEQVECGCVLGKDYPLPIVDHAERRVRALAMYRSAGEAYQRD